MAMDPEVMKQFEGLTKAQQKRVVDLIVSLSNENRTRKNVKEKRRIGLLKNEKYYISDDFDDPMELVVDKKAKAEMEKLKE